MLVRHQLAPRRKLAFARTGSGGEVVGDQKLDPAIHASTYVSGAGLVAIAALQPASLYDVERTGVLDNPRITELAAKGTVVVDPSFDALYPAHWPARLEVKTGSTTLHHEILQPTGDPSFPIGDAALQEKAQRILGHVGRSDAVAPLLALTASPFATDAAAGTLARFFVEAA